MTSPASPEVKVFSLEAIRESFATCLIFNGNAHSVIPILHPEENR